MTPFVIALFIGSLGREMPSVISAAAREQLDLSLIDPRDLAVFEVDIPEGEAFGWHVGGVGRNGYLVLDGWWGSFADAAEAVIGLGVEGL